MIYQLFVLMIQPRSLHSISSRAFDVELLYIAQQLKIPIDEVAVNWQEIEGRIKEVSNLSFFFKFISALWQACVNSQL